MISSPRRVRKPLVSGNSIQCSKPSSRTGGTKYSGGMALLLKHSIVTWPSHTRLFRSNMLQWNRSWRLFFGAVIAGKRVTKTRVCRQVRLLSNVDINLPRGFILPGILSHYKFATVLFLHTYFLYHITNALWIEVLSLAFSILIRLVKLMRSRDVLSGRNRVR